MPIGSNRLFIANGHTHKQDTPSDTWTVVHNLGREVLADVVVDIGEKREKILPYSQHCPDNNTLVVSFTRNFTGSVRVS